MTRNTSNASKQIGLIMSFVLGFIFLINLVSACNFCDFDFECSFCDSECEWCDWDCCEESECCTNDDCEEDSYSEKYCSNGNVYWDLTDYYCDDEECAFDIINELFENCGEDEYAEWNNYCVGKELWRDKTNILRGCSNANCFENQDYNNEYIDTCVYDCVDGSCVDEPEPICGNNVVEDLEECDDGNVIDGDGCSSLCLIEEEPECCTNDDCDDDYNSENYCIGNEVYYDSHNFYCLAGECVEEVFSNYVDTCVYDCVDGSCIDEPAYCGDGNLDTNLGETCDDGNVIDGDGCSSLCLIEEEPECCEDDDCEEDYSEKFCIGDDVYKKIFDYSCSDGECVLDISEEFIKECDEDCVNGRCEDDPDPNDDDKKRTKCCHDETCEETYYTYRTCEFEYNRYSDYILKNPLNKKSSSQGSIFLQDGEDNSIQANAFSLIRDDENLDRKENPFILGILLISLTLLIVLIIVVLLIKR